MADKTNSRQLVVIGAGPGGYAAAFAAADLGVQVTLIDPEDNPGGVCLYRGCIPSKALLHVAKIITDAAEAKNCGVEFSAPKIDVDKIRSYKNAVIQKLVQGLGQLCKLRKVEYIQGLATFIDSNTLEVERKRNDKEIIPFDKAIVATGASAATIPNIPAHSPLFMDSTKALELDNIPESMLVIGGGYIGLELGSVYAALGTKVSVVEMTPGLMPGTDPELVSVLEKRLRKVFKEIMLNTTVAQITEENGRLKVVLEEQNGPGSEKTFEKVLIAVGRKPNSAGLGLENTKVQIDDSGFLNVNEKRQTDDPSVFAIGDVAGGPLLAHKASHEARIAAKVITGLDATFEPKAIPFVEYTDPEIAECGLTEKQAQEKNRP
ncbi:MAG: dihydrolipoyl dehydrogenase family protein, partial [Planctomycetota bacterium]